MTARCPRTGDSQHCLHRFGRHRYLFGDLPSGGTVARAGERRRDRCIRVFLSLPLILPKATIGIALLMIFIRLGLAGGYTGIIMARLIPTIPCVVRILAAVYQGLGRDIEEQAMILGARPLQFLWRVILPMLLPGVVAGALFTFPVSINIFLPTFFLGQGQIITLPTLLFSKISGGNLDTTAAGITLIETLPGIILQIISERFIKEETFGEGFGS